MTLVDDNNSNCIFEFIITDPGVCSTTVFDCDSDTSMVEIISINNGSIIQNLSTGGDGLNEILSIDIDQCDTLEIIVEFSFNWTGGHFGSRLHGVSIGDHPDWTIEPEQTPADWVFMPNGITSACSDEVYPTGYYFDSAADDFTSYLEDDYIVTCPDMSMDTMFAQNFCPCDLLSFPCLDMNGNQNPVLLDYDYAYDGMEDNGDPSDNWGLLCTDDCPTFRFKLKYAPSTYNQVLSDTLCFFMTTDGSSGAFCDDFGCDSQNKFIINLEDPSLTIEFDEPYDVCSNDEIEVEPNILDGSNSGLNYNWSNGETGSSVTLPQTGLLPDLYSMGVTITDDIGCEGEASFEYTILETPEISSSVPLCNSAGGANSYSFEVCDDNSFINEWVLYDETCNVQIDGPFNGPCVTFNVSPFAPGDDLPVTYCVEAINLSTACVAYDGVSIQPPAIPDIPVVVEGCAGSSGTITLSNPEEFETWIWCDGISQDVENYSFTFDEDDICFLTVFDFNGCEITYEIEIDVSDAVEVEISGSTAFCSGSSTTLCATPSDPSYNYIWSTGATTECINVSQAGNYSVDLNIGNCTTSDNVDVTVGVSLTPIINGGDICAGGTVMLSTGNTFTSYEWTNDVGNIIDPIDATMPWQIEASMAGTYSVNVSDGSCDGSENFMVDEFEEAFAELVPETICNSSDFGDNTTLNLESLITSVNGNYTIQEPSGAILSSTIIDFEGMPAGIITYTVVVEGMGPCPDVTLDLNVDVVDCGCPELVLNPIGNYCNDIESMIDLNNYLGQFTDSNGSFTVDNPAILQIDAMNVLTIDEGSSPGVYSLTYSIDNVPVGCSDQVMVTFEIQASPELSISTPPQICNSSNGGNETNIDLSSLLNYSGDGEWLDENLNPIPNVDLDFEGLNAGNYIYYYETTDAIAPCENVIEELVLSVVDCGCPTLAFDTSIDSLCETDAAVDLNDLLVDDIEIGEWSTNAPSGLSGSMFDPQGLIAGIYTFDYSLINPINGCPDVISTDIEVIMQLEAGTQVAEYIVCESDDQVINLFDELSNADQGGYFQEISLIPSVGNSFDATNQTFDPSNQVSGEYRFEYIIEAGEVCSDVSSIVNIIIESNPIADAGEDLNISCGLNSVTIGGDNSSVGTNYEYTWTNDSGDVIYQGQELNFEVTAAGTYTLTVIDILLGCSNSDEIQVDVDPAHLFLFLFRY